MKHLIMALMAAFVVLAGFTPVTAGLPQGTFAGTGTWTAKDGASGGEYSGEYKSIVTITADAIVMSYGTQGERDGKSRSEQHRMGLRARPEGLYDLLDEAGNVIGQLTCGENDCTYTLTQEGARVESTLRLVGDELHTFGTKSYGDFTIVWREVLSPR